MKPIRDQLNYPDREVPKPMVIDQWYYFGCFGEPGHYLFQRGMRKLYRPEILLRFDGSLCVPAGELYLVAVSRLGGIRASALAFWDQTVDKRPGSNSVFFAPSLTLSPVELREGAAAYFPEVWSRLPELRLM